MVEKKMLFTKTGIQKVEDELQELKVVKRKEVAEKIKQALAFGDISENSEYDEAKNEQAQVEERIAKLEGMLRNAEIVDETQIATDKVSIGSIVKVLDLEFDEEIEFTIVGTVEADPIELKISNESPVGRALIGGKINEIIEIQIPDGVTKYKILDIKFE